MESTIILKRINNEKVSPIKLQNEEDNRPIKGEEICPDLYSNIYLIAPTNSGKTTMLFKLLKKFADRSTTIICFVSTIHNDPLWAEIKKYFKKKKINLISHMSMIDQEDGTNLLKEIVDFLKDEAKKHDEDESDNEDEEGEKQVDIMNLLYQENGIKGYDNKEEEDEKKEKKPRKSKYKTPEYILVFDDLSEELKTPLYNSLLKSARHYKIKTITSSQYIKDLLPTSRKQIRSWGLFSGLNEENIKQAYSAMDLRLPFELFLELYHSATEPQKNDMKPFLWCNSRINDFRRNFTHKYIIPQQYL